MSPTRTVAILVTALLLAACSSKQTPPQPDTGEHVPASHGSLAECLKANGVPDAGGQAVLLGPPAGVDQSTWDKAMKACATLAPGPGPAGP